MADRYKTYWRRCMVEGNGRNCAPINDRIEELPFSAQQHYDVEDGVPEKEALKLVNKWNQLGMGRFQYWVQP